MVLICGCLLSRLRFNTCCFLFDREFLFVAWPHSAVGGASDLKARDTGFDTRSGIYLSENCS